MIIINITLIYPRFNYLHAGGLQEALGLLYIASALRTNGHNINFIDLTFADSPAIPDKTVLDSELILMSATTALFGRAKEVLKYIKTIDESIPSVIGGPHAAALPFDALKSGFDYAVIGEGEETIVDLVNHLENNKKMSVVKGIAFKEDGKIKLTEPRPFIQDIDSIPFPARDLLDYEKYFRNGMNTIGIMAMRGCPYNCLFCKPMQNKLFGNKIRRRSVSNVVDELEEIKSKYGNKNILFKDDTLTTNGMKWFEEFRAELRNRGLNIDWGCQSRVNTINLELLMIMKESGCSNISFGVESGSQKILDFYRKDITVEQTINAFDMCRKIGLYTHAYVMLGAPIETREDLELTIKILNRIKPYSIGTSITTPAPGTDLYTYAEENEIMEIEDYLENDYYSTNMPMKLEHLAEKDLVEYKNKINSLAVKQTINQTFSSYPQFKKAVGNLRHPAVFIPFIKKVCKAVKDL